MSNMMLRKAMITLMMVTISAMRVMGLAQSCFNNRRIPDIRVPAMLMLMKKMKLRM